MLQINPLLGSPAASIWILALRELPSSSQREALEAVPLDRVGLIEHCFQSRSPPVPCSDLFYGLNVLPIHVPPVRNRKEDIPMPVEYFVKRFAAKARKRISTAAKLGVPGSMLDLKIKELNVQKRNIQ